MEQSSHTPSNSLKTSRCGCVLKYILRRSLKNKSISSKNEDISSKNNSIRRHFLEKQKHFDDKQKHFFEKSKHFVATRENFRLPAPERRTVKTAGASPSLEKDVVRPLGASSRPLLLALFYISVREILIRTYANGSAMEQAHTLRVEGHPKRARGCI